MLIDCIVELSQRASSSALTFDLEMRRQLGEIECHHLPQAVKTLFRDELTKISCKAHRHGAGNVTNQTISIVAGAQFAEAWTLFC